MAQLNDRQDPPVPTTRRVVWVSFLVDLFDVATNLVVAILTGSAVVYSEMAQGIADSVGSGFLVVGERRSGLPRDSEHPHGYHREAFFWALLSALTMLIIGAGLSAWRGYRQLVDPGTIENSPLAIGVLVLAIITNGYAVTLSLRSLTDSDQSLREAVTTANRPLVKSALFRDVIGTTTSIVGLIALVLYRLLDMVIFDSLGALVAAAMMAGASFVLLGQARDLIAGQSLPPADLAQLRAVVSSTSGVEAVNRLDAVHAGAAEIDIDLDLDLAEGLSTLDIEQLLDDLEARIRASVPNVTSLHVNLNSPEE